MISGGHLRALPAPEKQASPTEAPRARRPDPFASFRSARPAPAPLPAQASEEEAFHEIGRIIADACHAEESAARALDERRQWFKLQAELRHRAPAPEEMTPFRPASDEVAPAPPFRHSALHGENPAECAKVVPFPGIPAPSPGAALPGGPTTILLVDDEPLLRDIGGAILKKAGYEVVEAEDGTEALRLLGEMTCRPDLLITDMAMPGLSGVELAEAVENRHPGLPMILCSGYMRDALELDETTLPPGMAFLRKPYSLPALLGKVTELTGRPADVVR